MALLFISKHLNRRTTRAAVAPVLDALLAAARQTAQEAAPSRADAFRRQAAEAAAAGKLDEARVLQVRADEATRAAPEALAASVAYQNAADQIQDALVQDNIKIVAPGSPRASATGPRLLHPFDRDHIALQWKTALPAKKDPFTREGLVLLDYGDEGSVTITPDTILLTGPISNNETAILLAMRQAQLNWGNKVVPFGSTEDRFQFAVAAEMFGMKTNWRSRIPRARRDEAERLKKEPDYRRSSATIPPCESPNS